MYYIYIIKGMSQNTVSNPGSLTRGYDSWVWFGVWFVGMIRGPWFSVSLHPPRMLIYPHLLRKCFNGWQLYHTWSALELACCWRCACCCQSGVCCKPCFGVGMLVCGCGWKVLLEGAVELACWCCCKGWCFRVLQGGYVLYPTRAARVLVKGAAARCRVLLSDFSQKQQEV